VQVELGGKFGKRLVRDRNGFSEHGFEVRESDMAVGDESPKILDRQPGVDERFGDSNPLDIDRAEPVRIAWLDNPDFHQPPQSFEAHS
jgi:hypothetical protein